MKNLLNKLVQNLGLGAVIAIILAVLKILGVIEWSWLWVTAPFWIPNAPFVLYIIFAGVPLLFMGRSTNNA